MTFENLVFILKNYIKNKYKNIIINDIGDNHALDLMRIFAKNKCLLITLVVEDKELSKRVIGPRDSGFKDINKALQWNKELRERKSVENEHVIDNSHNSPEKTARDIIEIIQKS